MKNNVAKRVLALLLTLAMLLPYMGELMPVMQVNAATTTYGEANVYDIYDLTGSKENTIKGTDETWDGQIHANVSAEHKENIAFKTKLTMGEQEVRLSLNALDGASIYDPSGYSVFINHNGGAPYIAIKRNMQDLVVGSPASVAGTWELEIGIVDILTDGVRTGKHLYVKKDGQIVCEVDDTDGYLTGDTLGTKIIDFHYGAAIQMDTTYETAYGEANVYDIYDLTGSKTNTIKGTDEMWDGQIHANVSAEHKENFAFKTKLTMGAQNVRLSLTAKDGDSIFDPPGYAVYLYGADNVVEIRRNNAALKDATVESLAGTYTFEVGIVDILFGGNRAGKHLYVKINDVVVCEYDDMDGYLTGDALGTKIIDFHYGAATQMDSTYEVGYGTAKIYDIYDLTGTTAKSVDPWVSTKIGSAAEAHKEQAAIKMSMNITDARHRYRFSVGAAEGADCTDPQGYGLEIAVQFDGSNYVRFTRGSGSQIAQLDDVSGVIGEHTFEFGYRNITFGSSVTGKQVYLKVDGEVLYTYDDTGDYLTGEALGTMMALHHIDDAAVQMSINITNGTANVYDIFDLTGSATNTVMGTDNGGWSGQKVADISAEHKENMAFKTKLTMGEQQVRLSLNALADADKVDPAGYAVYIDHNGGSPYITIKRDQQDLVTGSVASVAGTWELEIGIVDILANGDRKGKHLYVKKDGMTVCEVDDTDGYLTGDALGTMIADFHAGADIQMDTANTSAYGTANVYDIYDLTGSKTNTLKGTDETWDGQIHANVSAEHKENIVFKTKLTMGEQDVRLSLNALDGASIYDPSGYSVFINHNGGTPYIAIKRNMQDLVVGSPASVAGTWELEIGIVDILTGGVRTGKHLYVKKDGLTVCEVDDTSGYLTGDTLGTKIIDFHYGAAIQMDTTYETAYGTANVYDIYDLTGSMTNTIKGTDETWDGQIHANVSADHKENFAFKTKLTMDTQNVRLSLTAKDGDSHYDPVGYAVYLYGADNKVEIRRNNAALKDATVESLAGTYTFEVGIVDILFGGNRAGKHLYVKINDVVVCEYDDMDGYLTGDALGTKIIDFHYGAAIQMDTTYETSHGAVNVYDIYDLTGSKSNTYLGSEGGNWSGNEVGTVADANKENVALKTKVMLDSTTLRDGQTDLVRLSLGATAVDLDYVGYTMRIYTDGSDNWYYGIHKGSSSVATSAVMTDSDIFSTYELEFGYRDIIFKGNVIGKQIYLKKNGVEIVSYDDMNGYLTGSSLGTMVLAWGYCNSIPMESTYETSYGTANVYDIYDLTGSKENTIKGTDETWDGQIYANVSANHKENFAFKTKLTMGEQEVRLSLTAKDGDDIFDPPGYAVYLCGADNKVDIRRNNASLKSTTVEGLAGTYTFEVGIVDILLGGNRVGKHLYVKINDVVVCEYDDVDGYLTGDALGTKIIDFHYGAAIQMDTTLSFFVHSYNLTLGGSTVMNLRLDPAEINDPAAKVAVSVRGKTTTYNLMDLPIDAQGLHKVSVPLAAPQMKDEVTLTVTRSDGETMTKSFTIAGYASYIYNGNYSDAHKAAVEAMLHYGAAAQAYFGYNVDNLANAGYTDSVDNTISNTYASEKNGAVSGVTIYGSSLVLNKNITLRHYLNITGDVSDYTFIFNGVEVTPQSTSVSGANYFVQLNGILPNALDGVYVLRVSNGSEAMEYKYCPMSYVKRMHEKGQLVDLMQELYDYHVAVKALAAANVTDSATVLDLYQLSGKTAVTIPSADGVTALGLLVGTEDSFVKKELTSNVAVRFKYTGGDGLRIQLGASLQEISYTSGALFMSVPANNSFGIANIQDNGTWCQDADGNDLFAWQACLAEGAESFIEIGCVKRYTNGVYTHDRYYVRAAASLAELELMAQNGTYSVYYDTTMRDNNGYSVIVRSRVTNGLADTLETTWTSDEITAYEEKQSSAAQGLTSDNYDALDAKYPEKETNNSNTAAGLAAAKNPDTTTSTGGDELILWAESGTAKIVQDDDGKAATLANTKNALSIQMAKNEDEGAQLMLFGKRNTSYEVFVTDLVSGSNRISAENIRLYQLKYLTVDDKSSGGYDTPSAYAGEKLPDAMLPFAKAVEYGENSILAGNNQAIYVDVSTKSTDAAGTYTGTIVVKTASHVYTLPISVVVQNVVMPENSQLGTYAPYLGRDGFTSGELDGSDEMASLYVQTLQDFNMSSIIPESDDVLNIEKFLVNVRRNYDNLTNYMLPVDFSDSYYTVGGNKTAVYCNYALMKEYVVALAKMSIADGKNYLDKAFFYPSDHADESKTEAEFNIAKATYKAFCQMLDDADAELTATYNGTSKYTAALQSSVKNLRFLLTVPGDDDSGKSLDIGTLLTDFLGSANRKNVVLCTSNEVLVREGYGEDVATAMNGAYADELWTYLCLKPYYPYSNYAFDTPVVGLRTLGWTCYQENVSTLMTWKSVDYLYGPDGLSLDRWTTSSAGTSMVTPGDGNVFYPGAKYGIDGPCPSLRAIAWRDGVDDYNLMNKVAANGGSAANLNTLYGLITTTYQDSIKASSETGSWWGSLISKKVNAIVPIDDDAKFAIVRNALLQMAASATSEHAAIISTAQSAVNGVATATGTTNALETPGSENTAIISGNIYDTDSNSDGYYQLADFESYAETIQNKFSGNAQLSLINAQSQTDNAQNGSYSLKVAVQPGQKGETVWIPTTSKYFSATTNFSGASKITFKVYNAQAADSTVRFYMNTYDRSSDVYNAGTYYKGDSDIWHDDHPNNTSYRFTLAPGWNTITIDGAFPSYVGAFVIAFDSGAGYDTQQVFYLDDVRVYMNNVG